MQIYDLDEKLNAFIFVASFEAQKCLLNISVYKFPSSYANCHQIYRMLKLMLRKLPTTPRI